MKSITSRSNPIVGTFRDLAATPDPIGSRLLLDGAHLVQEARRAGLSFECVAIAQAAIVAENDEGRLAQQLDAEGHSVVTVSDAVLRALSPVKAPSGIVAIARRDISQRTPSTILSPSPAALFLVVADVQDPGNLGALIRTAEAAGVTQLVTCGRSASPYGWRALRGSMGSALRLPIAQFPSTAAAFDALVASSTRTIGAVPRDGLSPEDVAWTGRTAIIVGSEGEGLETALVARCDGLVTIPMAPPVESLNVAVAGALLIYAARQQRVSARTTAGTRATAAASQQP